MTFHVSSECVHFSSWTIPWHDDVRAFQCHRVCFSFHCNHISNLKYHESQSVCVEPIHFGSFWGSLLRLVEFYSSAQHSALSPWTGAGHGHHSSGLCFEQQRTHARHQLPRWVLICCWLPPRWLDGWFMCFGGETQLFVLAIAFGILLRHIRKVTILYQIGVHELLMSIYDVQAMSYCAPMTRRYWHHPALWHGALCGGGAFETKGCAENGCRRLQCEQRRIGNLLQAGKESTWVQKSPPKKSTKHVYVFF